MAQRPSKEAVDWQSGVLHMTVFRHNRDRDSALRIGGVVNFRLNHARVQVLDSTNTFEPSYASLGFSAADDVPTPDVRSRADNTSVHDGSQF